MTIALRTTGVVSAIGGSGIGIDATPEAVDGDIVLALCVAKATVAGSVVSTPSDGAWTKQFERLGGGDGTVVPTTDQGETTVIAYTREKTSGWTISSVGGATMLTLDLTAGSNPSTASAIPLVYFKDEATWDIAVTTGEYGVGTTTATPSVVMDDNLDIAAGDRLIAVISHMADAVSWSAEGFTVPGCTIGTVNEISDQLRNSQSFDIGGVVFDAEVTAGTSSGAATVTATADPVRVGRGAIGLIRLREVASGPTGVEGTFNGPRVGGAESDLAGTVTDTGEFNAPRVGGITSDLAGSVTNTGEFNAPRVGGITSDLAGTAGAAPGPIAGVFDAPRVGGITSDLAGSVTNTGDFNAPRTGGARSDLAGTAGVYAGPVEGTFNAPRVGGITSALEGWFNFEEFEEPRPAIGVRFASHGTHNVEISVVDPEELERIQAIEYVAASVPSES
jgi:hypothetical protein